MSLPSAVLFILCLGLIGTNYACELTDEYISAKNQFISSSKESYEQCAKSLDNADTWVRYVQCIKSGEGKNVGGGCSHLTFSQGTYKALGLDSNYCETLKPESEEMKELFEIRLSNVGIKKCKNT